MFCEETVTLKCKLMNKNTVIMTIEYNPKYNTIDKIYEINNILHAPLSVLNASNNKSGNVLKTLNSWFKGRGIPSWRKDLEKLLMRLNVSTTEELLDKAYGLSLSDQYWFKEENSNITYKDINFFTNDFEYEAYLEASLDSSNNETKINKAMLKSPNNTTDGMLQKGWIIENNKRVLVKGTYSASREEPFNETLASMISKALGLFYCDYRVEWLDEKLVSKCDDFINEDEEIITAYDIFNSRKKPNNINDYEFYVKILEDNKVYEARKNVASMFLVDYLMLNSDRHLKNFGIIRNVNTLEWVRTTPIFDTGEAMECDKFTYNMCFTKGSGKFFNNTNKDYEEILNIIKPDLKDIDFSKLDGVVGEYKELLLKYQAKLEISDKRIECLVNGLKTRIELLKENMNI